MFSPDAKKDQFGPALANRFGTAAGFQWCDDCTYASPDEERYKDYSIRPSLFMSLLYEYFTVALVLKFDLVISKQLIIRVDANISANS